MEAEAKGNRDRRVSFCDHFVVCSMLPCPRKGAPAGHTPTQNHDLPRGVLCVLPVAAKLWFCFAEPSLPGAGRGELEGEGQEWREVSFEALWNENLHVSHCCPEPAVPQVNSSGLEHLMEICPQLCLLPVSPDQALTHFSLPQWWH